MQNGMLISHSDLELPAVTIARSFRGATTDPALDGKRGCVTHTDNTNNAEDYIHGSHDGRLCDGSVMKQRLHIVSEVMTSCLRMCLQDI
jgi:hypothetical protein